MQNIISPHPLTFVQSIEGFFLIEVQLIYKVLLISAVQQSDSVIHIYTF